jgi:DNA-binding NtrC family response regulator
VGKRIRNNTLVVDDDGDTREIIASYFEENTGYAPHMAANAFEALAHIKKRQTELLITDTNMPGMNGVDLLLKAKEYDPNLKVIVLFSGLNGSAIDGEEILRLGACMVLSKLEIPIRLFPAVEEIFCRGSCPKNSWVA